MVPQRTRFRFSLRTVLLLTAGAAALLVALRAALKEYQWQQARSLRAWVYETFDEEELHLHYFQDSREQTYVMAPYEFTMNPGGSVKPKGTPRKAGEIWVWPPGAWAATPQEAIQIFKNNS